MEIIKEISSFTDLGLSEQLCSRVKELGYEVPTPIQIQGIPVALSGRDLIGQAQTGTGKTAAFALPLLSKISLTRGEPQALVLTPTRELAMQVAEAFQKYVGDDKRFHVLPIYGGQSIVAQFRQLERKPQIVVGTPGRVMDHLRRGSLTLSSLQSLVLDEADEMLSMGFLEDIEWIISHAPPEKQTSLFSATMPRAVRQIAQTYLREPVEVQIQRVAEERPLIDQSFWFVGGIHKLDALTRILEAEDHDGVLIFVRTKTGTVELAEQLELRGYAAGALNGDMSQDVREKTVDRFKKGRLSILVATDVAARGLHVDRISHVINFDAPNDAETYTHRIGRTGRAGRSGVAVIFVSTRDRGVMRNIERATGVYLEQYRMPTREDIIERRRQKLKAKIVEILNANSFEQYSGLIEELSIEQKIAPTAIAAALCSMLEQDAPPPARTTHEKKARKEQQAGTPLFVERQPKEDREPRERRPHAVKRQNRDRSVRDFDRRASERRNGTMDEFELRLFEERAEELRELDRVETTGTESTTPRKNPKDKRAKAPSGKGFGSKDRQHKKSTSKKRGFGSSKSGKPTSKSSFAKGGKKPFRKQKDARKSQGRQAH